MWDRSKAVHTVQAGEGDPAATIGISDMVARLGHGGNRKLGGGFTSVSGVALQAASHFWALALLLARSLARDQGTRSSGVRVCLVRHRSGMIYFAFVVIRLGCTDMTERQ